MCQTIVPSWKRLTLALEQGTLDWAVGNRARIQQGTLNQSSIHLTYLLSITKKKAECWNIDAFELWCWRRLQSPLDSKEIKSVNLKGNQPWIFIGKTDAKAKTPILQSPDAKNWLIWKDPDAGQDWRREEKEMTEDEMVGWHHQFHRHEFE